MFGWCSTNQHKDCRVSNRKFWFEKRKRKEVIVFAEELTYCDCVCHNPDQTETKKPKRAARRKK